jgi:hypothetical protein
MTIIQIDLLNTIDVFTVVLATASLNGDNEYCSRCTVTETVL